MKGHLDTEERAQYGSQQTNETIIMMFSIVYWESISHLPSALNPLLLNPLFLVSYFCLGDQRYGPALVPFSPASLSRFLGFWILKIFFCSGENAAKCLEWQQKRKWRISVNTQRIKLIPPTMAIFSP